MFMTHKAIGPKRFRSNIKYFELFVISQIFRHIPVRNKITMAEKNPNIKQISDHKRVYIQELLRIVRENTQK